MTATTIYWIVLLLMLVGVLGSFLPGLPGAILILAGVIIWGATQGFGTIVWPLVTICVVLLLNLGIDFLATYWGAQKFGASKWGQIGAVVGMVLGVFGLLPALPFGGPLVGLLVGPILGAFVAEFLYLSKLEFWPRLKQSFLSSLGIVVGSVVGKVLQGILAVGAMLVFVLATWPLVMAG
jgi:uncharacterized protein